MKLFNFISAGALLVSACDVVFAVNPPLDRPSPPPCCADGVCYPNVPTWGWYETRWRRWPTESLEPIAAPGRKPGAVGPTPSEILPYETPRPEEEDRRAPAPTKPALEDQKETTAPPTMPLNPNQSSPGGAAPEGPQRPTGPAHGGPVNPTSPIGPLTPTGPANEPPRMPWENGGSQPTGDWDPPPTPPISAAVTIDRPPAARPAARFERSQPARPAAKRGQGNNDPPPSAPVSLAVMN